MTPKERERAYKCIDEYIAFSKQYPEHLEIQKQFWCFYKNAYESKRIHYIASPEATSLDEMMVFSKNRDTTVIFFITDGSKVKDWKLHSVSYLFAVKDDLKKKWQFYDHGATVSYSISRSMEHVINNERLDLVFKGFINTKNCEINLNFATELCYKYAGPCGLLEENKKHKGGYQYKIDWPPDSLYICE